MMKMTDAVEVLTPEQELNRIQYSRALNRRRFLTGLGTACLAAGATMVLGCGSSMKSTVPPVMAGTPQPNDVLNFALNLEYLEASFYLYATTGTGLSSADMGSGAGTVTGGTQVTNFSPTIAAIAAQIADDEKTHVELLRSALGSAAVAMPNINLGALGTINNQTLFLQVARAFEDTGVSAYIGAAQYLVSSVPDLTYAAQILAVEAYHASNIRQNIIQLGLTSSATDSMDVPPTTSAYFCEKGALAIERTPQEVLNIVYANTSTGVTSGGFYPNGLNGTIVST
ncbi:MAG: ferritin-like domain-containing protein [Acidobacteriaceae bacterium]